ncbi:hypothetical protein [Cellulomonas sp. SG140]|uniref:hypothetical protein n=1 Tax=Cellulomonas sp. SG140 TaxID=2976536 RepID=UPI0021E77241|nr:hypothetical protein [Cellulomonas sp. SG140]
MIAVTVTLGRNVGTVPMAAEEWDDFQTDAEAILEGCTVREDVWWCERHYGAGEWDGIREESVRVTLLGVVEVREAQLRLELAELADQYRQDAVALSWGESVLVARASGAMVTS